MTLTQLRHLIAIADSGLNITLAAERVHATQPGLSKQLRQLEDELGFQLFVRKAKGDPYRACGPVLLERADGAKPMTIYWKLAVPLPVAQFQEFSVLRGA